MLNFMICFFVLDTIRKNYDTRKYFYQSIDTLKLLNFIVVPILLCLDLMLPNSLKVIAEGCWFIVMCYILYILVKEKGHILSASFLKAGLPYFITFFLKLFFKNTLPAFYNTNDDYLDLLQIAAIVWLIAFGVSAKNQIKALNKEKDLKEKVIQENEGLEKMVRERTREITLQKEKLEETLEELKQTQNQLIQQEKLASLGELTAGIAHEIQNPLNFVNNFSEVSTELLQELKEELKDLPEVAEELFQDLSQNLEKISHHGKRASGIVRNMLEHSRSSTGERQKVNLNNLAEEYIKLSFHGLRAKDKTFNSDFKIHQDESLPEVEVIPQDLGRVLLNLCNNAFYAVQKRAKIEPSGSYKPLVSIQTAYLPAQNEVKITVSDNGTGIPEEVISKIFQPFFTTKPTGQGTGLGLSLSYDIVTKGHAGDIEVQSREGLGTQFIITLPLQ